MNRDESDLLEDIHDDVRESKTRIEVIDERTQHLDNRMDSMQDQMNDNTEEIGEVRGRVKRNSTVLGGFITSLSALLLWGADKLSRLI